jgi:hypothetical protein
VNWTKSEFEANMAAIWFGQIVEYVHKIQGIGLKYRNNTFIRLGNKLLDHLQYLSNGTTHTELVEKLLIQLIRTLPKYYGSKANESFRTHAENIRSQLDLFLEIPRSIRTSGMKLLSNSTIRHLAIRLPNLSDDTSTPISFDGDELLGISDLMNDALTYVIDAMMDISNFVSDTLGDATSVIRNSAKDIIELFDGLGSNAKSVFYNGTSTMGEGLHQLGSTIGVQIFAPIGDFLWRATKYFAVAVAAAVVFMTTIYVYKHWCRRALVARRLRQKLENNKKSSAELISDIYLETVISNERNSAEMHRKDDKLRKKMNELRKQNAILKRKSDELQQSHSKLSNGTSNLNLK